MVYIWSVFDISRLNGEYLRNETWYKGLGNRARTLWTRGFPTLSWYFMNFGSQSAKIGPSFYQPFVNSASYFIAWLAHGQQTELDQTLPNCGQFIALTIRGVKAGMVRVWVQVKLCDHTSSVIWARYIWFCIKTNRSYCTSTITISIGSACSSQVDARFRPRIHATWCYADFFTLNRHPNKGIFLYLNIFQIVSVTFPKCVWATKCYAYRWYVT